MKRFSIIMPAHNVSNYIEKSITSVLNQTYSNYELIIIDDCSSDDGKTIEKINQFSKNITLIQNKVNIGAGGSRNEGIKSATGEYIIFLDSDDILYSDTVLEKLDKTIGNANPDVIYMGFNVIGSRNFTLIPTKETSTKEYQLAKNKYINVWSKCWRREFLLENSIQFPIGVIYEDVPFAFQGISLANSYSIAEFICHTYTSGRTGSNASKNQFKQARDTVTCIENLTNIKDKINPADLPLLLERIEEQKNRLIARLDRVLADNFN